MGRNAAVQRSSVKGDYSVKKDSVGELQLDNRDISYLQDPVWLVTKTCRHGEDVCCKSNPDDGLMWSSQLLKNEYIGT